MYWNPKKIPKFEIENEEIVLKQNVFESSMQACQQVMLNILFVGIDLRMGMYSIFRVEPMLTFSMGIGRRLKMCF